MAKMTSISDLPDRSDKVLAMKRVMGYPNNWVPASTHDRRVMERIRGPRTGDRGDDPRGSEADRLINLCADHGVTLVFQAPEPPSPPPASGQGTRKKGLPKRQGFNRKV
jgi:hypothetical protein